jgi:hypothetical protein
MNAIRFLGAARENFLASEYSPMGPEVQDLASQFFLDK